MKSKTEYLFNREIKQPKFRISNKFDVPAVYFDGIHYFPKDIEEHTMRDGTVKKGIQAVYYTHKWYQDTMYKSDEFLGELLKFAKSKNIV